MLVREQQRIAQYRLLHCLARGGMSDVYLALDTRTGRNIALKLVETRQQLYCERLQHEAEAFKTLKHEHILPIFEYGEDENYCYIAMPYIAFGTLRERLEQGLLSTREAGALLMQLADALHFAHTHGIIHCDIKPSNILLHEGQHVYLADFGLVQISEEDSDKTQALYSSGTPAYMAPEMIQGTVSTSSDIYAIGVLLYQMLTGQLPFKSSSLLGVHWQHLHTLPEKPSTLNPLISSGIDRVVLQALEKEPARRFQTIRDLALAYSDALADEQILHTRRLVLEQQSRYRSHPSLVTLAATFCFLPALLGFSFYSLLDSVSQALAPVNPVSTASSVPTKLKLHTSATPPSTTGVAISPPLIVDSEGGQSYIVQVSAASSPKGDGGDDQNGVVQVSQTPSPEEKSDTPSEPPAHHHPHHAHGAGGGRR